MERGRKLFEATRQIEKARTDRGHVGERRARPEDFLDQARLERPRVKPHLPRCRRTSYRRRRLRQLAFVIAMVMKLASELSPHGLHRTMISPTNTSPSMRDWDGLAGGDVLGAKVGDGGGDLAELQARVTEEHALQAIEAVRQPPLHRCVAQQFQVAVELHPPLPAAQARVMPTGATILNPPNRKHSESEGDGCWQDGRCYHCCGSAGPKI
jgi:hypothetical protein